MRTRKQSRARSVNSAKNGRSNGPESIGLALAGTLGLIVLAFVILSLSSFLLPQMKFIEDMRSGEIVLGPGGPAHFAPGAELGSYLLLRLVLSCVNILLVVYLLFVYVKDYLHLRTGFALGIVAFLFSFLLYALSSFPLVRLFIGPRGLADVFAFIPLLFSAIGLVIFVKLSNE
ncbi:MAG: hypothetical protein V1728_02075 [Candidatus Micrarchaeota archaeon]